MQEFIATELPRLMQCNGSRLLPAFDFPHTSNSTREQGIAAHYMANAVFTGVVSDPVELVDRRAPNGVMMDAAMAEHVGNYLKICRDNSDPYVSSLLELPTRYQAFNDWVVNGRADHIGLTYHNCLIVSDFKYGFSIVEPDENWTLIFHAAAWCIENNATPTDIVLQIYQPRQHHVDGHLRKWPLSYNELVDKFNQLSSTLRNLSDMLQTGPQCHNCNKLPYCSAQRLASYNALEVADKAFMDDLPNDVLSSELDEIERAKKILDDRSKALVELARHRINNGQIIQDRHIEPQLGNRAWQDFCTPEMLKALTGLDLSKPGLITPAAAERAGMLPELVAAYTYRPIQGHKLVKEKASKRAKRLLGDKSNA